MQAGTEPSSQQETHPILQQALQWIDAAETDRSLITPELVAMLAKMRDDVKQEVNRYNVNLIRLKCFLNNARRRLQHQAKRPAQQDIRPGREQVTRRRPPEAAMGTISGANYSARTANSQATQHQSLLQPQPQNNQLEGHIMPSIDTPCVPFEPLGREKPPALSGQLTHMESITSSDLQCLQPLTDDDRILEFWLMEDANIGLHGSTAELTGQPSPNLDHIWDGPWGLSPGRSLGLATCSFDDMMMPLDEGPHMSTKWPVEYGCSTVSCQPAASDRALESRLDSFGSQQAEDIEGAAAAAGHLDGIGKRCDDPFEQIPTATDPVAFQQQQMQLHSVLHEQETAEVNHHLIHGALESGITDPAAAAARHLRCTIAGRDRVAASNQMDLNEQETTRALGQSAFEYSMANVEAIGAHLAPAADNGSEATSFAEVLASPTAVQQPPLPKPISETAPVVPSTALPPPTPAALELLLRQLNISQESSTATADNPALPSYWGPDRQLALFDPTSSMQVPTDRNEIDALQRAMIDQPAVDHDGRNVLHRLASAESHVEVPRVTALLNIVLCSVDGLLAKLQVASDHSGMTPLMTAASKGAREGVFDRLLQAAGLEVLSKTTNEGRAVHHCLLQAAAEASQVGNQTLRLHLRHCFCNTLEHMQNLYHECLQVAVARQQWPAQPAQQQQRHVQELLQKWLAPRPKAPGYIGGSELAAAVKAYKTRLGAALSQTHSTAQQVPLFPDEQLFHVLSSRQQLLGTGHDSTYLDTWQPGSDTSSLKGVTWDERGRINGVWLDYLYEPHTSHVKGRLPSSWSLCTNLTVLYLAGSEVSGPLPGELGKLTNLKNIALHWSMLDGPLPPSWSSLIKLQGMSLHGNRLTGCLPEAWSALSSLQSLYLSDNKLSGTLPLCYSRLTSLQGLLLSRNECSGVLPVEYSALTNLKTLDMSGNKLTGSLPPQYSVLTQLTSLVLVSNELTGPLPIEWSQLRQLKQLHLGGNCVEQQVPDSWDQQLTNLCRGIQSIWALRPMRFVMLP